MSDRECTAFLQWALPRRELRWPGFRKVRGQVCKRLKRRMVDLGLDGFPAYRRRLEADPTEWRTFDACCHITISRFFRDRGVFDVVRRFILPEIAVRSQQEGRDAGIWSAGCASGEEPYTLKIIWDLEVMPLHPGASLSITATDIDETMLARAREGCFKPASLRELPPELARCAFDAVDHCLRVRPQHREGIDFVYQDLRRQAPTALFDLALCRYLAFTYFAPPLQHQVMGRILERLRPGGYLVIGTHERLPVDVPTLVPISEAGQTFRKAPLHQA